MDGSVFKVMRCQSDKCNNVICLMRGSHIEIKRGGRVIYFDKAEKQKIHIKCEKCGKTTIIE